ncbi:hypothetical protein DXX93_11060 [Thalassotalea euphylliae]|uniref:Uncharacterized protein n=1 Tax=Thalassotalea euphylliae TaxID=1655234 RepID=A0A3E0TRT7_9GAMM|nr:hypothetical protein DXX93_11060 [Thalassotalea euphylliae]
MKSFFLHLSIVVILSAILFTFNVFSSNLNYGYIIVLILSLIVFYLFKLGNIFYVLISWFTVLSIDKFFEFYALLPGKAYDGFIYICVNALILSFPLIIIKIVFYISKQVTLTRK